MACAKRPGQIVILNGVPRAGKTSIATAVQDRFDGIWMNLGMDNFKRMTPSRFQPGIGLRPGGERPDLEPIVAKLYYGMYEAIANHSRMGFNVVADATHHESYSNQLGILSRCAQQLRGLPVLFVAVRCPIAVIWERRRATWGSPGYAESANVADPVDLWQRALEATGPYDLTLDTSALTPEQCAEKIAERLTSGPQPTALESRS